ncbi:MAG: Lactate utilization protein B [candidate division BRC1 bacterium ADurb.BinA364]|nr:MAG: Lactate utilization protein B [candidate division BRC1 bacterium ADurb.BinA364]
MPQEERGRRLSRQIRQAIEAREATANLMAAVKRGRDNRAAAVQRLRGGEAFRAECRAIKDRCLERQEELVERFIASVRARGAQAVRARDGAQAAEYLLRLARESAARTVIKSKSLTSEEIHINRPLEQAGLRVVETDLGELIIQAAGEKPYHLVFPSVHKTVEEAAAIFRRLTGEDVPSDPDGIMKVVRRYLRPIFLEAEIGLTGANIGVAETGAIVLETNEGNARLVSSLPPVHVCIIGQEKIVETTAEALKLAMAHPISATGQFLTTYTTFLAGRGPRGHSAQGGRESHIIVLDNGRTAMREDPALREALHCIRCGACMNICPTYGVAGGHAFGYIYPGPIGIPWTAGVHGLERAGDFAPLCIACGLCKRICPIDIDIPFMISEIKDRDRRAGHPMPAANRAMTRARAMSELGSAFAPLSNWINRLKPARWILEKLLGVDRRRVLPPFRRQTFEAWFRRRAPRQRAEAPRRRAALFVDIYPNYNAPHLARRAVELMEALGCEIAVPAQTWSGYPYIGYGDLDGARRVARRNIAAFAPLARGGYDIVAIEPTALGCLRHDYPKLLPESEEARDVAARTFELFEYLLMLEDAAGAAPPPTALVGRRFGFHISCHQRPLGEGRQAIEWLRRRGAEIEIVETGTCCGMGGTFGMKAGDLGYNLAQAVGEPLFRAFRESGVEAIATESSVCRMHVGEGTGLPIFHPLEIERRYGRLP